MKRKGFTLIELLAVIIILGILMIIAIPSVTQYIASSRDESYIATVKEYIGATRNIINSGKYSVYDAASTYYIPTSCIPMEKGGDTPYGKFVKAYVLVTYNGNDFDYYFGGYDEAGIGLNITKNADISTDRLRTDMHELDDTVAVNGRSTITKMNNNTCEFELTELATGAYGELGVVEDIDKYTITFDKYMTTNDVDNDIYAYRKLSPTAPYTAVDNLRNLVYFTNPSLYYLINYQYNDSNGVRKAILYASPPTIVDNATGQVVKVKKVYLYMKSKYSDKTGDIPYQYTCVVNMEDSSRFSKGDCVFNNNIVFGFSNFNYSDSITVISSSIRYELENGDVIDYRSDVFNKATNYRFTAYGLGNSNTGYYMNYMYLSVMSIN